MGWNIHKFGGTSLLDAGRISNAAELLLQARQTPENGERRIACVVSAMGGVTNELIRLTELAAERGTGFREALEELEERVVTTCRKLLREPDGVIGFVRHQVANLGDILRGVELAGTCPPSTLDLVSGFGEVWSAAMLQARLAESGRDSAWLDARDVLVVRQ